ncbi:MAG: PH domain-containing protein [Micromonosporaceae bacterium]
MGFPENVIASDEKVVLHIHPHWKVLVLPVSALILTVAAVGFLALITPWQWAQLALVAAGLLVIAIFTVWPFVKWATHHIVFTTHRVILREGVFARHGRDIPHNRINDVSFQQTLFERMLRCGTLTVASASEKGEAVLGDIPKVEKVQSVLYQLVEDINDRHIGQAPADPGY